MHNSTAAPNHQGSRKATIGRAKEGTIGMSTSPSLRLRNASLVFVAVQPIDVQTVSPEVFARNNIISAQWQTANAISLPMFVMPEYLNGAVVRAEGNRLVYQQNIQNTSGWFQEEYPAHTAARRYADASKLVAYKALGINWALEYWAEKPDVWLRESLAEDSLLLKGFLPTAIKLARKDDIAVCNISLALQKEFIALEFNYHIEVGQRTVTDIIGKWPQYQKTLEEELLPNIMR